MSEAADIAKHRRTAAAHESNLAEPASGQENAAEILRYIAEIDDLPIDKNDPILGQIISTLISTANITPEQVKSNEWMFEYVLVLYLSKHPPKYGMHSEERAIAHNDAAAARKPLDSEDRMAIESFIQMGKLALSRSEGFKAVEETTRNVQESVVHDGDQEGGSGSGGIWGKLRG